MKDRRLFNERKLVLEIKEFKKKKIINDITQKIKEKQKDVHKEINRVYGLRHEKLRHNALTNNHLSNYIANLNFRLYSLPEVNRSIKGEELNLFHFIPK